MPVQQPMPIQIPTTVIQQRQLVVPNLTHTPRQPIHVRITREGPASITRVVADLMVFVSFELEENKELVGLVFKPDKISGYGGEIRRTATGDAPLPRIGDPVTLVPHPAMLMIVADIS